MAFVFVVAMSKKIFDLRSARYGAIIGFTGEYNMTNSTYVKELEKLCQTLIPVYHKYYKLVGGAKPELKMPVLEKLTKQEPALFKPWPLDK